MGRLMGFVSVGWEFPDEGTAAEAGRDTGCPSAAVVRQRIRNMAKKQAILPKSLLRYFIL